MVLTKEELIGALQNEVRILTHLAGKVDKSKVDYRPTPKQRSILELLQYMAIMGPTQLAIIKTGSFNPPNLTAMWGPAEAGSKMLSFDQAVAAIQKQSDDYARILGGWTEADFRGDCDIFGNKTTRGALIVNLVLGGHAAYRTQLFCYLKSCGRDELNTWNLCRGVDGAMAAV
jgi:hypothetical protein